MVKTESKQGDNSIFPCLPYDTRVIYAIAMVGFSVGDRVVCGADKVLGNKPAKQRYGRLFRKALQGVVKGTEGSGHSKKYVVCFDEVTTTKAFSLHISSDFDASVAIVCHGVEWKVVEGML